MPPSVASGPHMFGCATFEIQNTVVTNVCPLLPLFFPGVILLDGLVSGVGRGCLPPIGSPLAARPSGDGSGSAPTPSGGRATSYADVAAFKASLHGVA